MKPRSLYAAFDLFPSAKGAATHIHHFSTALFEYFDGGHLFVLGNDKLPVYQLEETVEIFRFRSKIPNYLVRSRRYSETLRTHIDSLDSLELVHFRDIWSGLAALKRDRKYATVFEVNGLPSIELPYRYPGIESSTLEKLRDIENHCLRHSSAIIVPSPVITKMLERRGIPGSKITIENGADLPELASLPSVDRPDRYILYFGALQTWQGISTLFKAFDGIRDLDDVKLVICASNRPKYAKGYRKLAKKMGIDGRIEWHHQLPKEQLYKFVSEAEFTLAPLTACSRNLEQGCCPLKILESMACGTAVIASDIPVTRQLLQDRIHGKLVRPDRPALFSRAMRFLLDYPEEAKEMGISGQKFIAEHYSWSKQKSLLKNFYESVLQNSVNSGKSLSQ